eukprot:m.12014 g.12014  ORF g.12014 m.12014 type:complete len:51 (-) comp7100_c1_seq2:1887-2039(-)
MTPSDAENGVDYFHEKSFWCGIDSRLTIFCSWMKCVDSEVSICLKIHQML